MKLHHYTLPLAALLLTTACQKKDAESATPEDTGSTIELLSHAKGKFTVAETVTIDDSLSDVVLGGKSFKIKARWDDAEMKRETLNNNPKEAHAVELEWAVGATEKSLWLFATGVEQGDAAMLSRTTVQPRLLPPGSRIAVADELKKSLLRGVQLEWKKKRYDIPEKGQEVFSGWKVQDVRIYQHALLKDNGTIAESKDTSFSNRAVEVTVEATDGTKERHICFIDHPRLTAGIHPTILPVTRLSGDLASLARLTVCETLKAPVEKSLMIISPDTDGEGLNTWIWGKGEPAPISSHIEKFPATLTIDGQKVEIKQHWTKARRQIKWQQREGTAEEDKQPALLIETGGHFHAKQFVLIRGKSTPCRVMDDILILRYR